MLDINAVHQSVIDDISAVADWCEEIYQTNFSTHFGESRELFNRLKSKTHPITDEELSWVLINLPLNLFDVSEALNKLRVSHEVIKLKNKQRENELVKSSLEKSVTKRQEDASDKMIEYKLLATAYTSVITRVESEISFCRELIMGAKKIWDSRRKSESVNPISPIDESTAVLPDYKVNQYIKGGE